MVVEWVPAADVLAAAAVAAAAAAAAVVAAAVKRNAVVIVAECVRATEGVVAEAAAVFLAVGDVTSGLVEVVVLTVHIATTRATAAANSVYRYVHHRTNNLSLVHNASPVWQYGAVVRCVELIRYNSFSCTT